MFDIDYDRIPELDGSQSEVYLAVMTPSANPAGVAKRSRLVPIATYAVAGLPTITGPGVYVAFASDGRKSGEGAGVGTGVLCYWDGSDWIAEGTAAAVQA